MVTKTCEYAVLLADHTYRIVKKDVTFNSDDEESWWDEAHSPVIISELVRDNVYNDAVFAIPWSVPLNE